MEADNSSININKEVEDLIEELTTTGNEDLDITHMNKLKTSCKNSNIALEYAYTVIMEQLEKPHAEIRYSAFQILSELFPKSNLFRKLVANDLYKIFLFTVETDPIHYPSPLPTKVSKQLKLLTLKVFNEWYNIYGSYCRRITLGYEYLRDIKKVNFTVIDMNLKEEKRKEKEKEEEVRKGIESKLNQVDIQIYDAYDDITKNIKELENCFQLILPKVEEHNDDDDDDETEILEDENKIVLDNFTNFENEDESNNFDLHVGIETGIQGRNYNVTIEISNKLELIESEKNIDLIKRIDELYDEIVQQQITVKKWLHTLVKCNSSTEKIDRILNLKNMLSSASKKYLEMKIIRMPGSKGNDDDFVDVPENVPAVKSKAVKTPCGKPKSKGKSSQIKTTSIHKQKVDQTPKAASIIGENVEQDLQPSNVSSELSRKERLMKIAPVVPYDIDLQYWGKEVKPIPSIKVDSQHRFWKTSEHVEEFVHPDVVESMRTRIMSYPVKFEPVDRKCGARLPSGTLCERMDRYKCPFHGKIVERDEEGMPTDPEKLQQELKQSEDKEEVEMEAIQKKDNTPIGIPPYVKRRKTKKEKVETPQDKSKMRYARLSDIKKEGSSANKRLEKIVFNKRAMKKVNESLDSAMRKKQLGKFGQNFNYY